MSKKVSFKCSSCGKTHTYQIGATPHFATWQDAMAHIKDEKETDKLVDAYMKVAKQKTDFEMQLFAQNPAVYLTNINYGACGETAPLFDEEVVKPVNDALFNEKLTAQISFSQQKWLNALQSEGIVAFEALYVCPKQGTLHGGLFLQMRFSEDKKERVCKYVNHCSCGAEMILVNDQNVGFCHEGLPTVAKCKCGGTLIVDSVVFNK